VAQSPPINKPLISYRPIYTHLVKGQRDSRTAFHERIRAVYFSFADVLLKQAQHISASKEKTALINQARNILEEMKKAELENYFQDECVTAFHETQTSVEDLEKRFASNITPRPH